eukprot:scaffold531_cov30-Attheya_sp.AAC.3
MAVFLCARNGQIVLGIRQADTVPVDPYLLSPEVDHTTQVEVTRIQDATYTRGEPIGTERKAQHRTNTVHGKHELPAMAEMYSPLFNVHN